MLSDFDFGLWCGRNQISTDARDVIEQIRKSEPTRRVRSAAGNVSGRYPSRKMGRTIQFESHRGELAAILIYEHAPEICEFWDQPPTIKLNYHSRNGKPLGVLHTADFFVIREHGAGWEECKMEAELGVLNTFAGFPPFLISRFSHQRRRGISLNSEPRKGILQCFFKSGVRDSDGTESRTKFSSDTSFIV